MSITPFKRGKASERNQHPEVGWVEQSDTQQLPDSALLVHDL